MKTLLLKFVAVLCCLVFISSCSVEKRLYRSGYYVSWNKKQTPISKKDIIDHDTNNQAELAQVNSDEQMVSKNNNQIIDQNEVAELLIENAIVESNTSTDLFNLGETQKESSPVNFKIVDSKSNDHEARQETDNDLKKENHFKKSHQSRQNGGKLQIVALILCILLGLIGVHRFYLGYTGLGILYLLTLGIFGIGWLIDIVLLIIPNGLTPKGKSNYKAD